MTVALEMLSRSRLPLVLLPSGDTQQPTVTRGVVRGTRDLLIVVATDQQLNTSRAFFQRIVRPRREVPIILSGVVTPFTRTEPEIVETLPVDVRLDGDNVVFDPEALSREYGRHIDGVTLGGGAPAQPELVPLSPEERRLVHNLRELGATHAQIIAAQQNFRHAEDSEDLVSELLRTGASPEQAGDIVRALRRARTSRDRAGIAFSSGPLPAVQGAWLRGTHQNAGIVPEQVARQLRGRQFNSPRAFKRAVWRAVAETPELAAQFSTRELRSMRNGNAPRAPREQWYGDHIRYILHHQRPISRGGERYDMSNILIVTPRLHQDILDRRVHFRPPGDPQ